MTSASLPAVDPPRTALPDQPVPIAFCITELDPGGAERALVELLLRLDRQRWSPQVYVLTGKPTALAQRLLASNIPVDHFEVGGLFAFLSAVWKLVFALRRQRPQLLQTWLYHANIVGRVAALIARVPHTLSGIRVAERRSSWRLRIDRWTSALVSRHVCVSRDVATFCEKSGGLPENKIVVIPNGVDAARYSSAIAVPRASIGLSDHQPLLISVGRLDVQKAPHDVLSAVASCCARLPAELQPQLVFVGIGPLEAELLRSIDELQLTDRVKLLGRRNDVPELLKSADLFVLGSRWEGMPNVLLEAAAAGLPIVSTAVESVSDIVRNGETGLIVPPGDAAGLAAAIESILRQPDRGAKWGIAGRSHVAARFSWDRTAAEYETLYRSLLVPQESR